MPLPQKPEKAPPAPFRSENPPLRICPPAGIRPPLPAAGCGSPRPFFRKKTPFPAGGSAEKGLP